MLLMDLFFSLSSSLFHRFVFYFLFGFQTIEEMSTVSDSHAAVSALQAEANSANGVNRLVDLLNKVLRRLERQVARRSKRMARQRKGCKIVRFISVLGFSSSTEH
jgi:hypothetical protein